MKSSKRYVSVCSPGSSVIYTRPKNFERRYDRPLEWCAPQGVLCGSAPRTVVILAVRSQEEGCTLQRRTGRAKLLYFGYIVRQGSRVPVWLCRLGRVVVHAAHSGECPEVGDNATVTVVDNERQNARPKAGRLQA